MLNAKGEGEEEVVCMSRVGKVYDHRPSCVSKFDVHLFLFF